MVQDEDCNESSTGEEIELIVSSLVADFAFSVATSADLLAGGWSDLCARGVGWEAVLESSSRNGVLYNLALLENPEM